MWSPRSGWQALRQLRSKEGSLTTKLADALLHFIPAAILGAALARWPYGYYMLLRVVVLVTALLVASMAYQRERALTVWAAFFVIAAVIFNPFVPLHLTRGVWSILNVATAGLFVSHFIFAPRNT